VDLDKVNPDTVTVTITRHQPDGSWVSNGVVPNELDGHGGLALAAHSRQRASVPRVVPHVRPRRKSASGNPLSPGSTDLFRHAGVAHRRG
jgi:hypothetical protein